MVQEKFIFDFVGEKIDKGTTQWSAPSNIALIKYWGKKEQQIPANPSLSFTLTNCKTITQLDFQLKTGSSLSFDLFLDGQPKEDFKPKVQKFLERIASYCPYIYDYHFVIHTHNTFPHSSGIASSASGMAALSVNIMQLERALNPEMSMAYFNQKASFLARLGSGSACRSIAGEVVVWGAHSEIANSSDYYGVPFDGDLHPIFKDYQDVILLVDKGEKKVSSTVGHDLMHHHPFAQQRFEQAPSNLSQLKTALERGDIENFIAIVESEALTLHAMMMTSMPYFILMKPNTLQIIERIWNYRADSKVPVCFTLDAGANVHLLFPKAHRDQVVSFVQEQLAPWCQNGHYILDEMGRGAQQL